MNDNDSSGADTAVWAAYSSADTEADVQRQFRARYGHAPTTVLCTGGGWLAGPLRGTTEQGRAAIARAGVGDAS